MWVIQIGLIDAGSITCSLSVLLSAMEMSFRTQIALPVSFDGTISMHIHALTYYSRVASNQIIQHFCTLVNTMQYNITLVVVFFVNVFSVKC